MAGACSSCKSCCLGGLREGWKRLGGLGRANGSLEPPENRWQGHVAVRVVGHVVAVRVVALEACGSVWRV